MQDYTLAVALELALLLSHRWRPDTVERTIRAQARWLPVRKSAFRAVPAVGKRARVGSASGGTGSSQAGTALSRRPAAAHTAPGAAKPRLPRATPRSPDSQARPARAARAVLDEAVFTDPTGVSGAA